MPSEGERPPELLRADKEQLDRAAALLKEDRAFVIAVCPKELVPAARDHMTKQAGVEVPEPVVLQGSEAALEALVGTLPAVAGAKVRSLAIGGDAKETLRALNWHREKVLRGAPVVLWVDGVDGLAEVREVAPDAYAFRDVVVLVRGDGGRLPQVPYKDAPRILEARRRVARAKGGVERAEAYGVLCEQLRQHGHLVEAENVARRGLEMLPVERSGDERTRLAQAWLYAQLGMAAQARGSVARRRRSAQLGLECLRSVPASVAQRCQAWLLTTMPGPYECDLARAESALTLAEKEPADVTTYAQAMSACATVARNLGDLSKARSLLERLTPASLSTLNKSILAEDLARQADAAGRMQETECNLQESISLHRREHARFRVAAFHSARCWMNRGELDTAGKIVDDCVGNADPTERCDKTYLLAELAFAQGDATVALTRARECLRDAARYALDHPHGYANSLLADMATDGRDSDQLDAAALQTIAADLEVGEDVSRAICDNDPPPWYPIQFLGYRAAVLIRTDRATAALDLARRALDLARTTYPDMIPETGRALADHLLRAGKPDEALPILADVEPEAISRGMLKELGRIRAARVLALVLRNEPPSAIEPAVAALREALESTASPRIKAETLQELAIRLPPATALPDPLALASETLALFVEMPMPAKEARSLELAGDVLAARGKLADAKRRYLTARGILERRGLGLRLPLLTKKIENLASS